MISPFLEPGTQSHASSLAVLHLRRDQLLPVILDDPENGEKGSGYAEGEVINTRFGSFPHSTLVGQPWGSQVLASKVDTGSRGRKRKAEQLSQDSAQDVAAGKRLVSEAKRPKLGELNHHDGTEGEVSMSQQPEVDKQDVSSQKTAITAQSGFCHILPPTPESWTVSLPHRTQVVYTPDYSFIIQKLQIRPGSVVLEAGAGSGSFTHAAARAVFNGLPPPRDEGIGTTKSVQSGRVFSFEYNESRAKALQDQIRNHGLSDVVHVTHRDVYEDGFALDDFHSGVESLDLDATAVFLDLPAPWQALPHLTRSSKALTTLSPIHAVHLCCFLPCIEQVQRAATALQAHGWLEIRMEELQHRRLEVRRERVGLEYEGMRGVNATPSTVEESIARLAEVETRNVQFRELQSTQNNLPDHEKGEEARRESKMERRQRVAGEMGPRKPWVEGTLVHRTEPEMKTHTSYLLFATLPAEWSEDQERECRAKWPVERTVDAEIKKKVSKGKKS
ncbi:MAG: tRNA (adenine-N(1)-)-methyltransferase catalytic subunit trm61 [Chrysothrix sp. TS-e1954]|nr:MAG: tRNA (adenine-N(1)-)-methyltransferase catalytic subunit trm61 [Chrysothrix sp. TS-e1954]